MNIDKSLATARRQICTVEGAVRYVTERGHIRTSEPEKWEKVIYKVYVKKGVQYVEKEGKQIIPKKEVKAKKSKNISDVPAVADENTD
jgi:hypothetical protein